LSNGNLPQEVKIMRQQQIDYILTSMLGSHENVSDLNITVGKPFQVETAGELKPVNLTPTSHQITPFQAEILALNLLNSDRRLTRDLLSRGSCDISYQLSGKARFRVNIFSRQGTYSTVMRQLSTRIPTIEDLDLPPVFKKMAEERNGIILFTGATGTGKTTSLAAIMDEINDKKSVHIVTLEDPVEYIHPQKRATFNQRELGVDFDTYASGLRAALRQAPKVILVGEMRDRETVEIALSAAETGHLVFSTLHTVDAGQTINRIIGMFDQDEEKMIRIRLTDTVRWIVCQRLLPNVSGGRAAGFEIMKADVRVKDAIMNGETEEKTFYSMIEAGNAFGMMTFEQAIARLFKDKVITEQTAMSYSSRKAVMGRMVDSIKAANGEKTTNIDDLMIDTEYGKSKDPFRREW
jgi:twitching motility protein PilT